MTVSASSIKVGLGVAAGEDDRDHLRFLAEDRGDFFEREHLVADGVVDLFKDDEIPVAGEGRRIIFISRRTVYPLMTTVIGMSGKNSEGTIKLFCEDDASELMRQRDAAE